MIIYNYCKARTDDSPFWWKPSALSQSVQNSNYVLTSIPSKRVRQNPHFSCSYCNFEILNLADSELGVCGQHHELLLLAWDGQQAVWGHLQRHHVHRLHDLVCRHLQGHGWRYSRVHYQISCVFTGGEGASARVNIVSRHCMNSINYLCIAFILNVRSGLHTDILLHQE